MPQFHWVIISIFVTQSWLVGCSRNSAPEKAHELVGNKVSLTTNYPGREPRAFSGVELSVLPLSNLVSTTMAFHRTSPPPWEAGNQVTFHFRKTVPLRKTEEWAAWTLVNIHNENLAEITRRLKIDTIEVRVLHITNSPMTIQETGKTERKAIRDEGYALITDGRIPRKWLSSEPRVDKKTARALKAIYPEQFRIPN